MNIFYKSNLRDVLDAFHFHQFYVNKTLNKFTWDLMVLYDDDDDLRKCIIDDIIKYNKIPDAVFIKVKYLDDGEFEIYKILNDCGWEDFHHVVDEDPELDRYMDDKAELFSDIFITVREFASYADRMWPSVISSKTWDDTKLKYIQHITEDKALYELTQERHDGIYKCFMELSKTDVNLILKDFERFAYMSLCTENILIEEKGLSILEENKND